MVPFLRQLSGDIDSQGDSKGVKVGTTAAARRAGVVVGVGGAAATNTGVDPDNGTADAARPGPDGRERDLDAERQALLTMLLAHACFEHDTTPRTFVEQVCCVFYIWVIRVGVTHPPQPTAAASRCVCYS